MGTGVRHIDKYKTEVLEVNTTGNTSTLWVDMALYSHVTFFIASETYSAPTGGAVTINQATNTSGGSSKALTYNNYFSGTGGYASQASTQDVITQTTSSVSGSFTTGNTANTVYLYAIEVQDTDLDLTNAFKAVQLVISSAAVNTNFTVFAHCYPRFDGNFADLPTALT
jgi:hypothetical protein